MTKRASVRKTEPPSERYISVLFSLPAGVSYRLMPLDDHIDAWQMGPISGASIEEIGNAHPEAVADLRKLDPIGTSTMFAGLLAMPGLQANCLRIEALVHLAVAYCE